MMAESDSEKEIYEVRNEMPLKDFLDGTSARTRPLSYNEIMLRRKEKGGKAQQDSSSSGAVDTKLAQNNMDRASDLPDDNPQISDNSKPVDANKNSNDSKKVRSGRKADTNVSRNNENFVQDKDGRSLNPDGKSKEIGDKIERYNRVSEEKFSRKKADLLIVNSDYGIDKRRDSESYKLDKVSERSRIKSEIVKAQPCNEERQVYRKRKIDKRIGSDSDDYQKRNRKDVRQTDNSNARGSDKSSKEKKHKYHPEEDKPRSRNNVKMNEGEGTESTKTYLEESRSKKRWSRSKDREKVRGRRSLSQSPKAFKHTSKNKRELVETSSQSTKDKSEREHSIVDNRRMSSNGSNSHYRRSSNNSSGLGGYSPRKRKTEAAAKTPSPTHRSPERKNAGWDSHPIEKENSVAPSNPFNLNATTQNLSLNIIEYPSITTVAPTMANPIGISLHTLSTQVHAVETIQLTQATRPKRRLYVENLPVSASEKDLIECFNKLLMSSGVNYIQGKQPCISCIIHKEKNQAVVEFLTPEDASAALSFDGMFYSGSNLKLRRPKDYADVNTGPSDKSVGSVDSISDIVEDSPNKIFVGGLSKLFSSRMLLEIARAFGPLKAFHFEFIADKNEPCAFLEYVDHSVTSKACAGLNGMRLGGQVLTAVLATPEHVLENGRKVPTYKVPEHAKPLIKKPRTVLKLKNVFNHEYPVPLSESELEDILEDIRLECSRFGMVRSVNLAKKTGTFGTMEANETKITSACNDVNGFHSTNWSQSVQHVDKGTGFREFERSEPLEPQIEMENSSLSLVEKNGYNNIAGLSDVLSGSVEPDDITRSRLVDESFFDETAYGNIMEDEAHELPFKGEDVSLEEIPIKSNPGDIGGLRIQQNTSDIELASNCKNAGSTSVMNYELEYKPSSETLKSEVHDAKLLSSVEESKTGKRNSADVDIDRIDRKQSDAPGEGHERREAFVDLGHIVEAGSVIVEYRRLEAACIAAHGLHGRAFDGRIVTVEYVDERG